ncbi:MAG: DUF962 domain-containing protein [Myxococcales bacterium]|nr:DUF962 domain-containing protein [Myxococcales bacterium]
MAPPTLASFEEFFPYYLSEHADPRNRALHYVGTSLVIGLATAAAIVNPLLLLLMPIAGYGFAWVGHFVVERNRPATFTYPLWSLAGDFRMFFLFVTGRLGAHLEDARTRYPDAFGLTV